MANQFPVPFFTPSPVLSGLSIIYRNPAYIADLVAPRVEVGLPTFAYTLFNKADLFTVPDTRVSRTGLVNQVSWSSTFTTAAVEEHALEELVPRVDQVVAAAYGVNMPDPKLIATTQVTELMDLAHEVRTANLIFGPNSYGPNKTTLTGAAQWSDYTNSNPFGAIFTAIQLMTFSSIAPNTLILGQLVWNVLRQHPKLILAQYGYAEGSNTITLDWLTAQLGLDRIIIGSSKLNTSKVGQNVVWQPVWGKNAALVYQAPGSVDTRTATFAITAQFGTRVASAHFDIDRGWRGSDVVRVGEAHKELILAPDYGYLFQNVIA